MAKAKKAKKQNESFTSLDKLKESITARYGAGAVAGETSNVERVNTNLPGLDWQFGGGLPRGRVIEIFGPESSGKTSLCLHLIGVYQRKALKCWFVDAEHALDPVYAAIHKVDMTDLTVTQPDSGEQALQLVESLVDSDLIDLIVVDSVAALVPQAEIDGEIGDSHVGLQARMLSQAMRKLTSKISKTKTTVIFINQLRMKIGVMFGNPETTPGGNALKFYSSIRIDVRRTSHLGAKENPSGIVQKIKCVKNKVGVPFRERLYEMDFKTGYDVLTDVINLATDFGVLELKGAWYQYKGKSIGQGIDGAKKAIRKDKVMRKEIVVEVKKLLKEM